MKGPRGNAGAFLHGSVNIWPKDLGIVLEIAGEAGFEAPVTRAALARFMEAAAQGLGGEDDGAGEGLGQTGRGDVAGGGVRTIILTIFI